MATLPELKRRQTELMNRDREIAVQIGTKENLIETSITHLREVFGDDIPDDPTKIEFDKLKADVATAIQEAETEADTLLTEAEGKLDTAEEELGKLVGAE